MTASSQRHRVLKALKNGALLLALSLILFLAVNLAAHLVFLSIRERGPAVSVGRWFVAPASEEGLQILRAVFETSDDGFIRTLISGDPGIRAHPVLAFTEGHSRPYYTVGVEGIRYESGWSDAQVRQWLSETGAHTFLFGGSTAFGHGVTDDQTVAAALNRLEDSGRFLNFGVEAYDSIRETDQLLYLLRLGYRPAQVVFLDGLNDVTTFSWSRYRALDKPRTQGLLIDRGEVALIFGFPRRNNMLASLTFSLPVVQLARRLVNPGLVVPYEPIDAFQTDMNWQELMFFYENWDSIQARRSEELARELIGYYGANIAFVERLGQSFGFRAYFVLQPIGLLEEDNPFLKPAFRTAKVRLIFERVIHEVRQAIADKRVNLIDCSQAISATGTALGYVDASYYSPRGNEVLADCLYQTLRPDSPALDPQ